MNATAKACNQFRHGLNVASGSPEIHDAKTKSILPGDDSIGNECLATLFYGFQQVPIQIV